MQSFATAASRPLQRNTPTLESPRPDHDPLPRSDFVIS
jgi:hypothetical protein